MGRKTVRHPENLNPSSHPDTTPHNEDANPYGDQKSAWYEAEHLTHEDNQKGTWHKEACCPVKGPWVEQQRSNRDCAWGWLWCIRVRP